MEKIAFEILMSDGATPICVEIIAGYDESTIKKTAQEKYGERVYLFPCRLDATIEDANKPHDNRKVRGYGGFGI